MVEAWNDLYWQSGDGLNLHARDYPAEGSSAKLPVVCLHGLTRNARDFEALAPLVAGTGRRVLAVDVRGRGGSDRDPRADYRIPTYVDDIVRLAAVAAIEQAVFIGTSMGGLITMELAFHHPELVAAAVINDIGPEIAIEGLTRIAGYVGTAHRFADWDAAAAYVGQQNAAAFPAYSTADWQAMARRLCHEADGSVIPDYDTAIALPFADEPLQIDPWERWAALTKERPVLLLRGALSDLLESDAAFRMVAAGPTVECVTIPDVGHAPMLDEPAALGAVLNFLDQAE